MERRACPPKSRHRVSLASFLPSIAPKRSKRLRTPPRPLDSPLAFAEPSVRVVPDHSVGAFSDGFDGRVVLSHVEHRSAHHETGPLVALASFHRRAEPHVRVVHVHRCRHRRSCRSHPRDIRMPPFLAETSPRGTKPMPPFGPVGEKTRVCFSREGETHGHDGVVACDGDACVCTKRARTRDDRRDATSAVCVRVQCYVCRRGGSLRGSSHEQGSRAFVRLSVKQSMARREDPD